MTERETIVDIFGETCEVLDRCRCGAARFMRAGDTGPTIFHARGCLGLNLGAWHQEARAAMDEAGMRDLAQVEARKRAYGGNVERPRDFVGRKGPPAPIGRSRPL